MCLTNAVWQIPALCSIKTGRRNQDHGKHAVRSALTKRRPDAIVGNSKWFQTKTGGSPCNTIFRQMYTEKMRQFSDFPDLSVLCILVIQVGILEQHGVSPDKKIMRYR